ncbi:MAG: hypothetical protein JWN72_2182, partial [Thermoleophilia bacterium]|nr:hypothetical protein [Thermoleophilia bacterium]
VACVAATVAWTGSDGAFALSAACAALVATALGGARARPARVAPDGGRSGTLSP